MKRLLIVGLYALLFVPADPFGIAIPSVGGGAMACEWDPDTLTLRCGPGESKADFCDHPGHAFGPPPVYCGGYYDGSTASTPISDGTGSSPSTPGGGSATAKPPPRRKKPMICRAVDAAGLPLAILTVATAPSLAVSVPFALATIVVASVDFGCTYGPH